MNPDGSNQELIVSSHTGALVALAYDWVHGNLYFAEAGKIEVVTVQHKWKHVLFSEHEVNHISALVVDPRPGQGYVYHFFIYTLLLPER